MEREKNIEIDYVCCDKNTVTSEIQNIYDLVPSDDSENEDDEEPKNIVPLLEAIASLKTFYVRIKIKNSICKKYQKLKMQYIKLMI